MRRPPGLEPGLADEASDPDWSHLTAEHAFAELLDRQSLPRGTPGRLVEKDLARRRLALDPRRRRHGGGGQPPIRRAGDAPRGPHHPVPPPPPAGPEGPPRG